MPKNSETHLESIWYSNEANGLSRLHQFCDMSNFLSETDTHTNSTYLPVVVVTITMADLCMENSAWNVTSIWQIAIVFYYRVEVKARIVRVHKGTKALLHFS